MLDIHTEQAVGTGDGEMDTDFGKPKEMVKTVGESAGTLMSSLDMVHATIKVLLQQLDAPTEDSGQPSLTNKILRECKGTAKRLIMMIEGPVQLQKTSTVKSLSRLLQFVTNESEDNHDDTEFTSQHVLLQDYSDSYATKLAHEENHFKELVSENEHLKKTVSELEDYKNLLDKKEESFLKEKSSLNKKIKEFENRLNFTESEKDRLNTEIQDLKNQVGVHENENITKNEIIEKMEKESYDLIKRLEELQNGHTNKLEAYEKEISSLNDEKRSHQNKIEESNKVIEELRKYLEESKRYIVQKEDELRKLNLDFKETKDDYERNKMDFENTRESLVKRCSDLEHNIDSKQNEINRTHRQSSDLRAQISETDKLLSSKYQEIASLQKQIEDEKSSAIRKEEEFEKEKASLSSANNELENTVKSLQDMNENLEREKSSLRDKILDCNSDIKNKEENINKLSYRSNELDKKNRQLQSELESVNKVNEDVSKELENVKNELIRANENIENMNGQLHNRDTIIEDLTNSNAKTKQTLQTKCEEAKTEKEELMERINTLSVQQKKMQEDMRTKDSKIHEQELSIISLKKTNRRQKDENEDITKVFIAVEEELNHMKSKRILQVQLYCQSRTSLTSNVEEELMEMLKTKMGSEKLELDIVQCSKASDIQYDIPLLLLCITVSRLGTDVANTIHGLELSSKMALLIFHHKDVHALPNQASDRVLTGKEVRSLGEVYDLAFYTGKGIYSCEMNTNNIVSLINFINREGVKKAMYEQENCDTNNDSGPSGSVLQR